MQVAVPHSPLSSTSPPPPHHGFYLTYEFYDARVFSAIEDVAWRRRAEDLHGGGASQPSITEQSRRLRKQTRLVVPGDGTAAPWLGLRALRMDRVGEHPCEVRVLCTITSNSQQPPS